MKNIKLASNILKVSGGLLFASGLIMASFTEDKEGARNRIYLSAGLFGLGLAIDYSMYRPTFKKIKK